jgi:hypothetical protein
VHQVAEVYPSGSIALFGARQPGMRVSFHKCDHFVKGFAWDKSIGVEQQGILPPAQTESLVVCATKTQVIWIDNEMGARVFLSHHLRAAIVGGVVNHKRIGAYSFRRYPNGE